MLSAVNRSLARDDFARAAAESAYALQYEKLVRFIIMQSSDFRRRTQRAPRARPDSQGDELSLYAPLGRSSFLIYGWARVWH